MNYETERFYQNIKNKLACKEYRLGLDLGVGSIGWCILSFKKDNDDKLIPDEIILSGTRVFDTSKSGKDRRNKRLQRNSHRHKRERLFKLWKILAIKGLALQPPNKLKKENCFKETDTSKKRFNIEVLKQNPYILRYKSLYEKVDLQELGYIIYHLANHRGTSSVRTFEDYDENKKKEIQQIREESSKIDKIISEKNYKTYGEMLYKERIENKELHNLQSVRNRNNNNVFLITRDLIIKELKEILNKQKEYYPEVLTDEYIQKIEELVNFEYENIIPDPGNCPYFKTEKKLPKAHFLSEERRLWESLNNIRVIEPIIKNDIIVGYKKERELTKNEKEKLFQELKKVKELKSNNIIKILNLNSNTELILQGRDKENQSIKGYRNIELEKMAFWSRLTEEQKDSFFYDWLSIIDDKSLKKILKEKYHLKDNEIEEVIQKIEFPQGYSPIGKTATKILIEYIKGGLSFTEAIDKAIEDGKFDKKEIKVYDILPYYGEILDDLTQPVICKANFEKFKNKNYHKPNIDKNEEKYGRIPNPIVHQTLNELRKLVNEIIYATGKKPFEICLEVSRELKKSQIEREEIIKIQNANEKRRQEIYDKYLKGKNLSKDFILKFELYEEQQQRCPYCGEQITVDDIYKSRVDIDHIFPISESFDNSRNNLVLSHSKCNQDKSQRCPYDAFFSDSQRWNIIVSNLDKIEGLKNKKWRFTEGAYEKFLEDLPIFKRFETDTSYISKAATKYLSCLYDKKTNVVCFKGGVTFMLRTAWKLNSSLISYVKELIYKKEEEEFNEITTLDLKLRNDHRNHALDAIILAYTTREYSNISNYLSSKGINFKEKNWLSKIFLPPNKMNVEEFSNMIKEKLKETVISIKHNHNPLGELVKETNYKIFEEDGKYILVSRKKLKEIKSAKKEDVEKELITIKETITNVENLTIKKFFERNKKIFSNFENNIELAKKQLQQELETAKQEGKKVQEITESKIIKKALELTNNYYFKFEVREKNKFFAIRETQNNISGCGYDKGDNLCIDLYYNNNGKLCGEIIRKIDYLNKNFVPNYKKQGFQLVERIYQGDILECDVSKDKKALSVSSPNAPNGRVFVKVTTFTELPQYYEGKFDQIQIYFINLNRAKIKPDDSFYISSMKKYKPRKVILTTIGAIKYRSKILEDKNVENN